MNKQQLHQLKEIDDEFEGRWHSVYYIDMTTKWNGVLQRLLKHINGVDSE